MVCDPDNDTPNCRPECIRICVRRAERDRTLDLPDQQQRSVHDYVLPLNLKRIPEAGVIALCQCTTRFSDCLIYPHYVCDYTLLHPEFRASDDTQSPSLKNNRVQLNRVSTQS